MFTDEVRAALDNSVDTVIMPGPEEIRRRGTARAHRRMVTGVAAVVVLLVAAGIAFVPRPDRGPEPGAADLAAIPDSVLLRPADIGGAQVTEADLALWREDGRFPPRPCADSRYPSDSRRVAERAVHALMPDPAPSYAVLQYVARYEGTGAEAFLAELRSAVTRCGIQDSQSWVVEGAVSGGDDGLILRNTVIGVYADNDTVDDYFAVVRVGRTIMVLGSFGTQTSEWKAATTREVAMAVAPRLRQLD